MKRDKPKLGRSHDGMAEEEEAEAKTLTDMAKMIQYAACESSEKASSLQTTSKSPRFIKKTEYQRTLRA
jgi:hypothetical protein